jgi:prepilin-type N-terminal cleavage/methylation domain-containing protein
MPVRPRHRGITLVEVLVVMAIISIMISMLVPVLFKALTVVRHMKGQ